MPIRLDERILVNILRVLLVAEHVQRQPQNTLVVPPHQLVERAAIATLRLANQLIVLDALLSPGIHLRLSQLAAVPRASLCDDLCHWCRFYANQ